MKIKKIEWRNVASYGNKVQKLELPDKSGLIQVVGENGVGKSTISDVITFGLYGKLEGKKLKDIPNRSNKCAWMKIEFEQDGKVYEVERGLEPAHFQLTIDGNIYDQAGKNNVQEFLSEDILKIPYYVFNNTISLSINDFKSFLKMSTADKKLIIDKIFGFYILNEMRDILKEEGKTIKSSIDRLSGEIFATGRSIAASQKELEELQQKILENSGSEIESSNEQLENYKELLKLHSDKLKDFRSKENEATRNVTKSYELYSDLASKIKDIDSKMNLYNNEKCPTCASDLSTDFHKNVFDDLSDMKIKFTEDLADLKKNYNDAKKVQSDLATIKNDLFTKGGKIESAIRTLHDKIKTLNEEFNAQIFHLGEEISTQTLSTGEMKKVDFAVLVAIIKLMKIRFSSVNILFLDEIFSSVDPDGVHSILNTLRKLSDDLSMNIFVINHAPMPTEIFDYKIEISKKNNFSDIAFDKMV
jgi:DNA repair exonuclease SbcCD ATPase subunit